MGGGGCKERKLQERLTKDGTWPSKAEFLMLQEMVSMTPSFISFFNMANFPFLSSPPHIYISGTQSDYEVKHKYQ